MSVTNGMIKDAVYSGANTLEEVQDATGAGTVCGACIDDIQHLVEFFLLTNAANSSSIGSSIFLSTSE